MSASQLTDVTKIKILEWRMAILWFFFFSSVSLASATIAALQNVVWANMDAQAKILMALCIFVSWGTTMMAFFSKAAKKVENQITDTTTVTQTNSVQVTQPEPIKP